MPIIGSRQRSEISSRLFGLPARAASLHCLSKRVEDGAGAPALEHSQTQTPAKGRAKANSAVKLRLGSSGLASDAFDLKREMSSTDYVRRLPPTPPHHPPPSADANKASLFIAASSSLSERARQVRKPVLPPHRHVSLTCETEGCHSRITVRRRNGSDAHLPANPQAEG